MENSFEQVLFHKLKKKLQSSENVYFVIKRKRLKCSGPLNAGFGFWI